MNMRGRTGLKVNGAVIRRAVDRVQRPSARGAGEWTAHLWRNYSLSLVLAGLFLVSWALQTWSGWHRFAGEQESHGQVATLFGASGYVWEWASTTMENWQSEFLQLLTFVVLTAFLIHRGSHESRDGDDEMKAILLRIEEHLQARRGGHGGSQPNSNIDGDAR